MAPTENIKRQVAVAVIIAVKEPPLLIAMHRIISGIKIENDLVRRSFVRFQEQVDHQLLYGDWIMADLVIPCRLEPSLAPVD